MSIKVFNTNFYPRSPCGERRPYRLHLSITIIISIHALLAESDLYSSSSSTPAVHFYPRSPCGERRTSPFSIFWICHFYPRSPCGERPLLPCFTIIDVKISIHALLAESDPAKSESLTTYLISIHALLAESD